MANPSRSRLRWTDEEADILKELWPKRDVTIDDICKVLRRSGYAVVRKAKEQKLESRFQLFTEGINRDYLSRLMEVVDG